MRFVLVDCLRAARGQSWRPPVLVLVNGKRRHASSVMNFNNVVGRGSVPVDLNTLPLAAIERVEILRDGAAAQYGSDAIAGVINIVLRSDTNAGNASLQSGATEDGDGENASFSAYQGWSAGDDGFISLSGEARYRDFDLRAISLPSCSQFDLHGGAIE